MHENWHGVLSWCPFMTPTCCGKKLRRFHKSSDVHRLETRPCLREKKRVFEKERVRYEGDAAVSSSVSLEIFSTLKIHYYLIHVKLWNFSGSVCYI